jgi:hypothetical protein
MSYSEENGQVVLTMSREDYEQLIYRLGVAAGMVEVNGKLSRRTVERHRSFMNRLNEGNPNYTPYEIAEK